MKFLYIATFLKCFLVIYFLQGNFVHFSFSGRYIEQEYASITKIIKISFDILSIFIFCYIGDFLSKKYVIIIILLFDIFFLFLFLIAVEFQNEIYNLIFIKNKIYGFGFLILLISIKIQIINISKSVKDKYFGLEFYNFVILLATTLVFIVSIFYKQNNILYLLFISLIIFLFLYIYFDEKVKNEQNNRNIVIVKDYKKFFLYSIIIQMLPSLNFYLIFIYFGNILKNNYGYKTNDLILNSFYITQLSLLRSIITIFLLIYKVNIIRISLYSLFFYGLSILAIPTVTKLESSKYSIILLQILLTFFNPYYHSIESIIINNISGIRLFTSYTIITYISKILSYIFVAFFLEFGLRIFNHYGICFLYILFLMFFLKCIKYLVKVSESSKT
jgi:hypothetical protein